MAVQVSTSDFFNANKARVKAAVEKHKSDDIKTGIVQLPSGIRVGIAELKQCYFNRDEQKTWFRAMGVVEEPQFHAGVPIRGLQTSQYVQLRTDTDAHFEEDVAKVMQIMCALAGAKLFEKGGDHNFVQIAQMIQDAHPYFRFSTSDRTAQADNPAKGVKKGDVTGVWENWHGVVTDYKSKVVVGGGIAVTPTANGATGPKDNGHANAVSPPVSNVKTPDPEPPTNTVYRDDEDLDSLAARAYDDDEAKDRLTEMAKALDYTDDDVTNSPSWEVVVGWIKTGNRKGEDAGPAEPEGKKVEPKKDDPVSYSPPDPKDKSGKRRQKPADCKVVKVNKKDETVTLARLDDLKKTYESVPWADLKYDS